MRCSRWGIWVLEGLGHFSCRFGCDGGCWRVVRLFGIILVTRRGVVLATGRGFKLLLLGESMRLGHSLKQGRARRDDAGGCSSFNFRLSTLQHVMAVVRLNRASSLHSPHACPRLPPCCIHPIPSLVFNFCRSRIEDRGLSMPVGEAT